MRRKGERGAAQIRRELPHHVVVVIDETIGGLLWDIGRLCQFLGGASAGSHGRSRDQTYCFPTETAATEFARRIQAFGLRTN